MNDYVIYRHGSNAANQPMTAKLAVALVTAESEEAALDTERVRAISCYPNQQLTVVPASECDEATIEDAMGDEIETDAACVLCGQPSPGTLPVWQARNYHCGCTAD